jgi:hypothetical protein
MRVRGDKIFSQPGWPTSPTKGGLHLVRKGGAMAGVDDKPYGEFGNLLSSLAHKHHMYEHRVLAKHLEEATGYGVGPDMLARYLRGESLPGPLFVRAFAKAFCSSTEERSNLAWLYSYGRLPGERAPSTTLAHPGFYAEILHRYKTKPVFRALRCSGRRLRRRPR